MTMMVEKPQLLRMQLESKWLDTVGHINVLNLFIMYVIMWVPDLFFDEQNWILVMFSLFYGSLQLMLFGFLPGLF